MNPAHLDTLLAILDEGSFEGAAFALGISPSAVSQRMKALEHAAGRVLIRRATPPEPTEAGEVIAQMARKMGLLRTEVDAQLSGRMGALPLAVSVNADSLSLWFPQVLSSVASWPNATLHVRVEDETHSKHLLSRGDVMGAVTTEARPVAGCEVRELGVMRYVSVANPRLLDRFSRDGEVDWEAMPVLRFGPRDRLQDLDLERRIGYVPPRRNVSEIPSVDAFLEATRLGLGWSLLPEAQAQPLLARGELVLLDAAQIEVALYWQCWRLESSTLHRLSRAVQEAASVLPPIR
ncbi:LysR family transcriptional regulator ArgP [Corynebacterium gerontici]|uniref:Putative HTH-type transcriptional regulator n=1 Tax=Corynebacterium gerontici TaxID=2079234 RepID=A0A3G6J2T0_9CORY|nr:LysR family transcriptional regulator ArgP [Corynebacterium gerontici]AZA11278.1 putative HTH-type transcriptional regulator [Corynebacterium gerontici]